MLTYLIHSNQSNSDPVLTRKPPKSIIKIYGSATTMLAIANIRTEALTRKAIDEAQTAVKTSAKTKKKNLPTSSWKPKNHIILFLKHVTNIKSLTNTRQSTIQHKVVV